MRTGGFAASSRRRPDIWKPESTPGMMELSCSWTSRSGSARVFSTGTAWAMSGSPSRRPRMSSMSRTARPSRPGAISRSAPPEAAERVLATFASTLSPMESVASTAARPMATPTTVAAVRQGWRNRLRTASRKSIGTRTVYYAMPRLLDGPLVHTPGTQKHETTNHGANQEIDVVLEDAPQEDRHGERAGAHVAPQRQAHHALLVATGARGGHEERERMEYHLAGVDDHVVGRLRQREYDQVEDQEVGHPGQCREHVEAQVPVPGPGRVNRPRHLQICKKRVDLRLEAAQKGEARQLPDETDCNGQPEHQQVAEPDCQEREDRYQQPRLRERQCHARRLEHEEGGWHRPGEEREVANHAHDCNRQGLVEREAKAVEDEGYADRVAAAGRRRGRAEAAHHVRLDPLQEVCTAPRLAGEVVDPQAGQQPAGQDDRNDEGQGPDGEGVDSAYRITAEVVGGDQVERQHAQKQGHHYCQQQPLHARCSEPTPSPQTSLAGVLSWA